MPPEAVEVAMQPAGSPLKPQTALVLLENTHNYASGAVVPLANAEAIRAIAARHGVPVHLDGARVFNAAVALGVPASRVARDADTVQFCFSKGLCAPVGSVLCGSAAFIDDARRVRQSLGGAMRQAGVLAAPALLALEKMPARLSEDHARAKRLAKGLAEIDGLRFEEPETNILIVDVRGLGIGADEWIARMAKRGVGWSHVSAREVRACTYREIDDAAIERAIEAAVEEFGR
jgi:threonine aldolase